MVLRPRDRRGNQQHEHHSRSRSDSSTCRRASSVETNRRACERMPAADVEFNKIQQSIESSRRSKFSTDDLSKSKLRSKFSSDEIEIDFKNRSESSQADSRSKFSPDPKFSAGEIGTTGELTKRESPPTPNSRDQENHESSPMRPFMSQGDPAQFIVAGSIGDQRVRILVDTGATISFITSALVPMLRPKPEVKKSELSVVLGNSETQDTDHYVEVPLTIHSCVLPASLHLLALPNAFDIIVGLDWLALHDSHVHVRARSLEITNSVGKRIQVAACGGSCPDCREERRPSSGDTWPRLYASYNLQPRPGRRRNGKAAMRGTTGTSHTWNTERAAILKTKSPRPRAPKVPSC